MMCRRNTRALAHGSLAALAVLAPASAMAQRIYYVHEPGGWSWGFGSAVSYFLAWLGMTVASGLLALLLVWLVPERSREAVYSAARREPGSSVGAGLLLAIALPLLGLALVLTVIGSPLGLAVWVGALLLAFVGFVAGAFVLGRWLAERRPGQRLSGVAWLFIALAILCALSLVPVLGTFVWVAASVYGAGAIALAIYRGRTAQLERQRRAPPGPPPTPGPERGPEPTPPGYPAGT